MKKTILYTLILLFASVAFGQTCPPPSQGGPSPSYSGYYTQQIAPEATITYVNISNTTATFELAGSFTSSPWANGAQVGVADSVLSVFAADQPSFGTTVASTLLHGHALYVTVNLPYSFGSSNGGYLVDTGYLYVIPTSTNTVNVEVDSTVDGQTTGNVACMSGSEPTPHTFGTYIQPQGGTAVSGYQAEPLSYSTKTFPLSVPLTIRSEELQIYETVECPAMGQILYYTPDSYSHLAIETVSLTTATGQCETHNVSYYGVQKPVTNCVYNVIPQCTGVPSGHIPDINVSQAWFTTNSLGNPVPKPWGADFGGSVYSNNPNGPWSWVGGPIFPGVLSTFLIPIQISPQPCTYTD